MQNERTNNDFFQVAKGVGVALAFSLIAVIIFASVLRFTTIPSNAVYPVNQTIKIIAVCIGSLLFIRGEKGLIKGLLLAGVYTMLSYLTFSSLGGDFSLAWTIFVELALSLLAGGICGVIAVNKQNP